MIENNNWFEIKDCLPEQGEEVLFFNKEWIDEDFNPTGTRTGFYNDDDFITAHYWNEQDCYVTIAHWICDDSNEYSDELKKSIDPTHWKKLNNEPPTL